MMEYLIAPLVAKRKRKRYLQQQKAYNRYKKPQPGDEYIHRPPNSSLIESEPFTRALLPDSKRRVYETTRREDRTVCHWGQRKLLLSEIEFLTEFGGKDHLVVYAGAAPGTHIPYLGQLFPEITFHLWDPSKFAIEDSEKIKIFQDYFTSQVASEYKDKYPDMKFLFVCDIRTSIKDEFIEKDIQLQREWYNNLNPEKAMLKFRFPYTKGQTEYLDGEIKLPVWGPQTTTETRLIPDGNKLKTYDHTTYEEQMFYFNTVTRIAYYSHDIKGEGIDHCYDCRSEIFVLREYLLKLRKTEFVKEGENGEVIDEEALGREISEFSKEISRRLSKSRNLLSGTVRCQEFDVHINSVNPQRDQLLIKENPNFKN